MWRLAASCGRAALVAAAPAPGPFRSEIARRHAGGPRLSRPHPRRVPFRSEVARRHAGGPRLSRPYPRRARSEVKSRGVMREGRACRGRTRAASRSEVKSRGVMREGRACRGRTRAGPVPKRSRAASCGRAALVTAVPAPGPFRSEVARRHAGGPRLSRPYPRQARSEAKSRGVMREGRACHGRTRAGPVPK